MLSYFPEFVRCAIRRCVTSRCNTHTHTHTHTHTVFLPVRAVVTSGARCRSDADPHSEHSFKFSGIRRHIDW